MILSPRMECHAHTEYSNIRLIDSINKVDKLIDRAIELGLSGICITDHECLSAHIKAQQYAQKIKEDNPEFKIALGNEIYLCSDREKSQKYYHFILIAKNKDGYKALKELSSRAWMNIIEDRRLERVITTYDDLKEISKKYPDSLIGSTACLGGELSALTLQLIEAEELGNKEAMTEAHDKIVSFILMCRDIFGENDFYIECQPAQSKEQIAVNKRFPSIAKAFGLKMIVTTDAHFLKKEDRFVHKAYLNSKEGDREVDAFYQYAYLQSNEEIYENLEASGYSKEFVDEMFNNSHKIYNKIENFDLSHKQVIPKVKVTEYPKKKDDNYKDYKTLYSLLDSDNSQERCWVNDCLIGLKEHEIDEKSCNKYLKQLDTEAEVIKYIGDNLEDCLFAYFNTFKHFINLFWDCGSIVGPGRGSACGFVSNYLLGITQVDPLVWGLPWWRFLNRERVELPDIDIDLCPSKRPGIVKKIKEERGRENLNQDLDEQSKQELGCVGVATFGTEGTRSTIQTACRGYRSEEYPDGIDSDVALYMASLIPEERGFLWSLEEVLHGNEEKGRKPVKSFIKEVEKYPNLIDIMLGIEGLINKRSSHASGFIFFDDDPYDTGCFMKTPKWETITQWDLHDAEWAGMTKYDLLVTEISDKIVQALTFLQNEGQIKEKTIREAYNVHLHPKSIDVNDKRLWDALAEGSVLSVFQFDTEVGGMAAKKIKPESPVEMMNINAAMRLMAPEKGGESPIDKYYRFKNNFPNLWHQEMDRYGLTQEEKKSIEHIYAPAYGCPSIQEDLMMLLMENCNFSLADANWARKIVAKKQMNMIPELREKIEEQVPHKGFAKYLWDTGIKPQLGYAFSSCHSLPYSFVGIQSLVLATKFDPIYWNTACLVVNSGSLESEDENAKEKGTDYGKMAKAIGDIMSRGIHVSLVDINKSDYGFKPDVKNNQILFGMKGINKIGDPVIEEIMAHRPYKSLIDFISKCPLNKTQMVSLIKAGAFDNLDGEWAKKVDEENPRRAIMGYYVSKICEPKSRITLQNFKGLLDRKLLPKKLEKESSLFEFNRYIKSINKGKNNNYLLDARCLNYLRDNVDYLEEAFNNLNIDQDSASIESKVWDKIYKKKMDIAKDWLKDNQTETLSELNKCLFEEAWRKYADGTVSFWEMESLCFYYHEHELANINKGNYGIVNFSDLPKDPAIEKTFKKGPMEIPIYKIYRIAGTVIGKNKTRSSISLLTEDGVVNVKFTRDFFAMFDKQISDVDIKEGRKKVLEKGWFSRGTKLIVTGFRRQDTFVGKVYKSLQTHQLYKITKVSGRKIEIESERCQV